MGVTPKLVGGAWVGGEYRQIHFRSGALGQGSRTALPIFGLFMRKVLSDPSLSPKYLAKYPIPEGVNPADIAKRDEPVQRASEEADSTDFTDLDAPYQELENQANPSRSRREFLRRGHAFTVSTRATGQQHSLATTTTGEWNTAKGDTKQQSNHVT